MIHSRFKFNPPIIEMGVSFVNNDTLFQLDSIAVDVNVFSTNSLFCRNCKIVNEGKRKALKMGHPISSQCLRLCARGERKLCAMEKRRLFAMAERNLCAMAKRKLCAMAERKLCSMAEKKLCAMEKN